MLSKYFNLENTNIMSKKDFKLYPKASNRDWWENISPKLKAHLVSKGEKYLDYSYPLLLASDFLKFEQNGDRLSYETPYAQRRDALNCLILAECAEHKGRFINDIINGIYLICDETSWVVPAHNYKDIRFGTHDGNNTAELPRDDNIVIELNGSKTASDLAVAYYLLKSELDLISPMICRRIERKIEERIILPYEKYDEYFWKSETNNWNPQCNVHCLIAGMIMIDDDERRKSFLEKVLRSVNVFYSSYPNDGGCDEGTVYWAHSCGNLFRILDFVKYISYGKIDMLSEQKLCNMAAFPANMYIGDSRFVNFGDCLSHSAPSFELLYNWGKAANNESVVALSKISKDNNPGCVSIEDIMVFDEIDKLDDAFFCKKEIYYPDLQVLVLRDDSCGKDIFFSAKGGHNNESHNHCDVGSFMIYKNKKPVVIDPGTQMYVASSFTPKRYEIWYNNSLNHNLPVIGGKMQKNGPRYDGVVMPEDELVAPAYGASDVKYENNRFSLDISKSYGDENIKKWQRKFYFDKEACRINVTETYELLKESEIELVFMLPEEPGIGKDSISLSNGVTLCAPGLTAEFTRITDIDSKMAKQWEKVFRLSLLTKGKSGTISYHFQM